MKRIQSIIYIAFILGSVWLLIIAASSYENPFSIYENPLVPILMALVALVITLKEYINFTSQSIVKKLQNEKLGIEEEEEEEEEDEWIFIKGLIQKFTKSKDIEENSEIILDHNYDGIQELDNVLPPWWVYLFYATIFFAGFYIVKYEIMDGETQVQEYDRSMTEAKVAIANYKKSTPNAFDISKATLLTDASAISRGKAIFKLNCAACHADDGGGGIGPNLTDKHWILGGGFKNVVKTLLEGGREGKGMVSWKATLKPEDLQKVASYVISLQGTTPSKPKAVQGDLWKGKGESAKEENKDKTSEKKKEEVKA